MEEKASASAVISVPAAVAPALDIGPVAGGYIVDHLGWSWVFLIKLPVSVLTLAAGLWLLWEQKVNPAKPLRNLRKERLSCEHLKRASTNWIQSCSQYCAVIGRLATVRFQFPNLRSTKSRRIPRLRKQTIVGFSFQDEFRTCFEKIRDQ